MPCNNMFSVTINRTLVELKLVPVNILFQLQIDYQSYLSGIKTAWEIDKGRTGASYQSYLSGIKTFQSSNGLAFCMTINRTLVELKHEHGIVLGLAFVTINRTLVELKHYAQA